MNVIAIIVKLKRLLFVQIESSRGFAVLRFTTTNLFPSLFLRTARKVDHFVILTR